MLIDGKHYHTIWLAGKEKPFVQAIDQTLLPYEFRIVDLHTVRDIYQAIRDMRVRGAPLIGASAAYGIYLALLERNELDFLHESYQLLLSSRPTAINLKWALDRSIRALKDIEDADLRLLKARQLCDQIVMEDLAKSKALGEHGLELLKTLAAEKPSGEPIHILTHCNAGWLGCIDWGTATAPLYLAEQAGLNIHVWVDETRPRNQGALTAWEFKHNQIPHTVIVDNAGGHLMQKGLVDMVIVGTDRTFLSGHICNKIGTYLKALAAHANEIPFYVAVPSHSLDFRTQDPLGDTPIEERSDDEIRKVRGLDSELQIGELSIYTSDTPVKNFAFDITPPELVTALITERGICKPNEISIRRFFPETMSIV
ncbi:MAG: S-methyl-5-thioribose-1-phosphate isomerase [Candidatus Caenarcaniphilales bacterium]|nr:S-methyl-5-thioribose-1-phosphate isomerase [Candidatus Caenarcaniphilales bacterium]